MLPTTLGRAFLLAKHRPSLHHKYYYCLFNNLILSPCDPALHRLGHRFLIIILFLFILCFITFLPPQLFLIRLAARRRRLAIFSGRRRRHL